MMSIGCCRMREQQPTNEPSVSQCEDLKNKTSATIERTCCIEMKLESLVDHAHLLLHETREERRPLTTDRETCSPH